MHAPDSETSRLASLIDHTLLRPEASRAEIDRLCDEAMAHGFATVCVNPAWVVVCADRLRAGRRRGDGSTPDVADASYPLCGVCTVVGFPLGATVSDVKAYETRRAIADGATEIDMVINIGALKSGDLELVARDIRAVTRVCRDARVVSKVIVEAALLSDEEKVTVCMLADAADADFVKTSTGCGPGGATATDVALMRRTVRARMGVKASGGIRTLATLREMVQAGAARIGTSAGVRIMAEARNGQAHSVRGT